MSEAGANPKSWAVETIYRPFFRSAIVVVLTAGAAWGEVLTV